MSHNIHGVTFDDYCAVCAFQTQGKTIAELLTTLGVDAAQWAEADAYWQQAMAQDKEFKLTTRLGEVFQNPAVGKFAGASTTTIADNISKVPNLEAFVELQEYISAATQSGEQAEAALKTRDLSLSDYSQISMHYQGEINALHAIDNSEALDTMAKYHTLYAEKYKAQFE